MTTTVDDEEFEGAEATGKGIFQHRAPGRFRLDIDGDGFKPVARTIILMLASPSVQRPAR